MNKCIKKSLVALSLFITSSVSYAQLAVFDASNFGELIEQGIALDEEYQELIKQGANIQHALETLGDYTWSNNELLSLMTQLNSTMERNQAISYTASNLDSQFALHFPGYVSTGNGQTYQQQYQANTDHTLATINNALASIGINMNDLSSESSRLDVIHTHVQGAVGQTQALQALSEVNEELVTQTQSLRQIVSAQANSESTYYAQQIQKEASSEAELQEVLSKGKTDIPAYAANPDECF